MKKKLEREQKYDLWHYNGLAIEMGPNPTLKNTNSNLAGDCTDISGDASQIEGDCSDLFGDCTGVYGMCTGIAGNFDACEITKEEREKGININSLVL